MRSLDTASLAAGDYSFKASVADNANYLGDDSDCEPFKVAKANPTMTTEIHKGNDHSTAIVTATYGDTVHDKASVAGAVSGFSLAAGGGTVDFTFYTNAACDPTGAAGTAAGSIAPNAAGVADPSTAQTPAAGSYSFKARYTGNANYNPATSDCEPLTVNKKTLTVTADNKTRQYSDPNPAFTFQYSGFVLGETPSLLTTEPTCLAYTTTTYATPVTPLNVGPGSYPIHCSGGVDENYVFTYVDGALAVTQEDALATYTGDMLVFTPSGGGNANVTLRATIRDITAVDPTASPPNPDNYPGVITNATATIKVDGTAPQGCSNLPVSLIGADTKVGSASCSASLSAGSQGSTSYTISVVVGNYYVDTENIGVVEVAQPNGSFITGGGYLVESGSAGTYAADNGSRMNFGFNVKYNKNGTNPQGHVNAILRKGGRVYQIKSNSIDSFGTSLKVNGGSTSCSGPPSSTCWGLADFKSKANLTDVTNPLAPVSLGGNLQLQLTLTDKGEPGSSDTIAVTLWNGSTLLFSSRWNGSSTVQDVLGGGNLVVH